MENEATADDVGPILIVSDPWHTNDAVFASLTTKSNELPADTEDADGKVIVGVPDNPKTPPICDSLSVTITPLYEVYRA
jgi:hypothetical protein